MVILGNTLGYVLLVAGMIAISGFDTIEPRTAVTLVLWGEYKGTIKNFVGPCYINPLYTKAKISLQFSTNETMKIKVNDKGGNPIIIAASYIWTVQDTYLASFEVENYKVYVDVQAETALRNLAMAYNYDTFDDADDEKLTLRGGTTEIQRLLVAELNKSVSICGAKVIEARITELSYAPEIM